MEVLGFPKNGPKSLAFNTNWNECHDVSKNYIHVVMIKLKALRLVIAATLQSTLYLRKSAKNDRSRDRIMSG